MRPTSSLVLVIALCLRTVCGELKQIAVFAMEGSNAENNFRRRKHSGSEGTIDEVFELKSELASDLKDTLDKTMAAYGLEEF